MKRSRAITLVLLGTTGLVGIAGCDQPDPTSAANFYRDQQQCERSKDADACRQAFADARAEHLKTAPAFTNKAECEAKFGVDNCQETKQKPGQTPEGAPQTASAGMGGSWFLPVMMGYMMGRTLNGFGGQPIYRDTANTAYSGGKSMGQVSERYSPPPRAPGDQVARGGFGKSAVGSAST
jgi:uncharacterized protein YgiB involved in biofilm formation